MGNLINTIQKAQIPEPNKRIIQFQIGKIRSLHKGFQMLCDSFALNLKEFEQIFALDESVFALWDTDCNGLIDAIEFFCALVIFSNSRLEDKVRFLFEFFDFNERNYLEEADLHFLVSTCIGASFKLFIIGGGGVYEDDKSEQAYISIAKNLKENFPPGMKITINILLRWAVETLPIKEFFTFLEITNQNIQGE